MLGIVVSYNQTHTQEAIEELFRPGERVAIIDGPLKGKVVTIKDIDTKRKKINATIQIIGGNETKIILSYHEVRKA